jgi:uncharacterized protein
MLYRLPMRPGDVLPLVLMAVMGCAGAGPVRSRAEFLVHSRDTPGSGAMLDRLAEQHWGYMDRFAGQLVARGPTISDDGEQHTGSVHILAAGGALEARRFAEEEPYHRAGLYAATTVVRFVNLLGRSMWDRPPLAEPPRSTFVVARWPSIPADAGARRAAAEAARAAHPDVWVFLGLLLGDDGGCVGIAAALDAAPGDAERSVRQVMEALGRGDAPIESQRWSRGGRPGAPR